MSVTIIPLFDRTVSQSLTSGSSDAAMEERRFVLPLRGRRADRLMDALMVGPQTELMMTLRDAFCTSGSAITSPPVRANRMLQQHTGCSSSFVHLRFYLNLHLL